MLGRFGLPIRKKGRDVLSSWKEGRGHGAGHFGILDTQSGDEKEQDQGTQMGISPHSQGLFGGRQQARDAL